MGAGINQGRKGTKYNLDIFRLKNLINYFFYKKKSQLIMLQNFVKVNLDKCMIQLNI